MKSRTAYIVPSQLLLDTPPKDDWDATAIPADPSQSLLLVAWDNPNHERDFESLPAVLHLGLPWESPPTDAIPLLASLQSQDEALSATMGLPILGADQPAPSLARVLRGIDWPLARLVR